MRVLILLALAGLSACSWLGLRRTPPPPGSSEFIVTGSPAGALLFIDDVQVGQAVANTNQTQVLTVAAGTHKVQVQVGGKFVYREDAYVARGEHRVVVVKSGFER